MLRGYVYGCGFSGVVSALGLLQNNTEITGIDTCPERISQLTATPPNSGDAQIDLLLNQYKNDPLSFLTSAPQKQNVDFCLLALATPFDGHHLNIDNLTQCCIDILKTIQFSELPTLIIRSTLPIGGLEQIEKTIQDEISLQSGKNYQILYMPEFMREGTGLEDWNHPPLSIIGLNHGQPPEKILTRFGGLNFSIVSANEAEVLKLSCNAFHALKVTFANEIMRICEPLNISSHRVMDLFCKDEKLNISTKYLDPGFAWGGGCLEKDLRGLLKYSKTQPLLESINTSNLEHIKYLAQKLIHHGFTKIGFYELSFKPGVKDTRHSPVICLIEYLISSPKVETIKVLTSEYLYENKMPKSNKIQFINSIESFSDEDCVFVRSDLGFDKLVNQNKNFEIIKI